jgi:hypothetical protein
MNAKRRSGILLLLLPGLVGGTLYIYLGKPRIEGEVRALGESIVQARAQRPSPAQEAQLWARERELQAEVKRLEELRSAGTVSPAAGSGERLAFLLARNKLLLLEETLDPPVAGSLPQGLEKTGSGRLRQLKLSGRYLDVLSALRSLPDPSIGAIPLRLVMARDGTEVQWTLLLWM